MKFYVVPKQELKETPLPATRGAREIQGTKLLRIVVKKRVKKVKVRAKLHLELGKI